MPEPEDTIRESPVDFDTAVAYALHPEMRRLVILSIAGTFLLPVGMGLFLSSAGFGAGLGVLAIDIVRRVFGLAIALVGAAFFVGSLVGGAFKVVADANILAEKQYGE